MARLFRSVVGLCIVLLAAFVWGGCSKGVESNAATDYPQGCVVVAGAKILKYSPSEDARTPTLLAYRVEEAYPATRTIGTITKELARRGWKPVDYLKEMAPPGEQTLPMNQWVDTEGMPGFLAQGPSSIRKVWPGYWRGPEGEFALYQLTYSLSSGSGELEPEVTVVIRCASAEVARNIREEDRKQTALTEQWNQGKINQEEYQRQMEAAGAKVQFFAQPEDLPSTDSITSPDESPEFKKLDQLWMAGKISDKEYKRRAQSMGIVVELSPDEGNQRTPSSDLSTLPPKERDLMKKLQKSGITAVEFHGRVLSLPPSGVTTGSGPGMTPAPVPMFGTSNNPPEYYPLERKWLNGEISDQEFFRKLKDMGVQVDNSSQESPTPASRTTPTLQGKNP